MRVIWCKNLEDLINLARGFGWIFQMKKGDKYYYYLYVGHEHEMVCLAVEVSEPIGTKYATIDDDGKIKSLNVPVGSLCVRIVEVVKDESFEEILKERK